VVQEEEERSERSAVEKVGGSRYPIVGPRKRKRSKIESNNKVEEEKRIGAFRKGPEEGIK